MLTSIKNILAYIPKILQILLFVAIFLLALKNTDPIMVDVYLARFQMPLIILMVALLMIGMLMGFLLTIPRVYRLKQKLKQISKDLDEKIAAQAEQIKQAEQINKINQINQIKQAEHAKQINNNDNKNSENQESIIGQLPPQA